MKPHEPVKIFLIAFLGYSLGMLIFYSVLPEYNFAAGIQALYPAGRSTPEAVYSEGFSNLILFKRIAGYTFLYWGICLAIYLFSLARKLQLSRNGVYLHLLFSMSGVVLFVFLNPYIIDSRQVDVSDLFIAGDRASADLIALHRNLIFQSSVFNAMAVPGLICFVAGLLTASLNLKSTSQENC